MADGKIYITISDKRGEGPGTPDTPKPKNPKPSQTDNSSDLLNDYLKHTFFNFVTSEAKQVVTSGIANIGNFTGDYVSQQQVQNAVSNTMKIASIFMSAKAGFVASGGNPIGALAGAAVAIVGQGINAVIQDAAYGKQIQKQNYQIEILRNRSGLNSSIDGNRGTLE